MQSVNQRRAEDYLIWVCITINAVYMRWHYRKTGRIRPPENGWKDECRLSSQIPCAIMLLTWFADTLLVLLDTQYTLGISLFCCVQLLYAWCLYRRGYLLLPVRLTVLALAAGAALGGGLAGKSLAFAAGFSFSQLLVNVVCGVRAAEKTRRKYDILFAAGLMLFLGCDLCVGFRNLPVSEQVQNIAYTLNWIFYIPSQMLLTISLPEI